MEDAVPPEIIVERSKTVRPINGPLELGLLDVLMVIAWKRLPFREAEVREPIRPPAWEIPGHARTSLP
jgi:hypothetical protein